MWTIRLLLLFLLLPISAFCAEWDGKTARYINPNVSGGANTGLSWKDAWTALPTTLTRDYVYYVADGSHSAYDFSTAISGSLYVYIVKASIEDHGSDDDWEDAMGDGSCTFSTFDVASGYLIFDGQYGGGPGNWNGTYGFRVAIDTNTFTKLMRVTNGPTYVSISHVDFSYDYNDALSYRSQITDGQDAIYENDDGFSNWVISYSRFNRPGRTAFLTRKRIDEFTIEYCHFRYTTFDSLTAEGATMHGELWSADHTTDQLTNLVFRNNWVYVTGSTGTLILSGANGAYFYGNIFEQADTNPTNGVIGNWSAPEALSQNFYIYNNTFIDGGGELGHANMSNLYSYNNLFINTNPVFLGTSHIHDYNAGDEDLAEDNAVIDLTSSVFADYPDDLRLSEATQGGRVLSAEDWWDTTYCSAQDMLGNTRGTDGTWDRGAYEYGSGTVPPSINKATFYGTVRLQ